MHHRHPPAGERLDLDRLSLDVDRLYALDAFRRVWFDVNTEGEAVIPIRSSLVIGRPYLFAVTVERPGGVAKSAKERVPIIAAPKSDA